MGERDTTYEHQHHQVSWFNGFPLQVTSLRRNANSALGAREAPGFGNIRRDGCVVSLLRECLHLAPDRGVLGPQEELHDLIELRKTESATRIHSEQQPGSQDTHRRDGHTNPTKRGKPKGVNHALGCIPLCQ